MKKIFVCTILLLLSSCSSLSLKEKRNPSSSGDVVDNPIRTNILKESLRIDCFNTQTVGDDSSIGIWLSLKDSTDYEPAILAYMKIYPLTGRSSRIMIDREYISRMTVSDYKKLRDGGDVTLPFMTASTQVIRGGYKKAHLASFKGNRLLMSIGEDIYRFTCRKKM